LIPHRMPEELSEDRRREIYQALADEQDLYEFTAEQARQRVTSRYGISDARLREIEREGRENLWPPF
jgi:hypothetical protein